MSSTVTRRTTPGGKSGSLNEKKRPTWIYPWGEDQDTTLSLLEMVESLRNVAELTNSLLMQIRDKQMLQCDVRRDIGELVREIRGLRRDLRRKRAKTRKA